MYAPVRPVVVPACSCDSSSCSGLIGFRLVPADLPLSFGRVRRRVQIAAARTAYCVVLSLVTSCVATSVDMAMFPLVSK